MHTRKRLLVLLSVCLLCVTVAAYALFAYRQTFHKPDEFPRPLLENPNDDAGKWGTFGDYMGGVLNPFFAFLNLLVVVYIAFEIHYRESDRDRQNRLAEKRQRAVELLNQFMAGEFFLRARLICQQYLLPSGSRFELSVGAQDGAERLLDFNELAIHLGDLQVGQEYRGLKITAEDKDASYYIRAIPSYFWLLDQALSAEHILPETIFSVHYTWYWLHIIRFRRSLCWEDQLFQRIEWLLGTPAQRDTARSAIRRYLDQLSPSNRARWCVLTLGSLAPDDAELPLLYYET